MVEAGPIKGLTGICLSVVGLGSLNFIILALVCVDGRGGNEIT